MNSEGELTIRDLLLSPLAVVRRVLQYTALVRRSLFSMVTLTGHDCGKVMEVERRGSQDHTVTCDDGRQFHVFVTQTGRVAVEEE